MDRLGRTIAVLLTLAAAALVVMFAVGKVAALSNVLQAL